MPPSRVAPSVTWQPRRHELLWRFLRDRTAVVGSAIVVIFVLVAIAAPLIAPHDPTDVDARAILAPPSGEHWLGTDNLGRDILSRLIYGARWTLGTAFLAATLIVTIGVIVGLVTGYFGGWINDVLMRVVDVLLAFPSLVLATLELGSLMLAIAGLSFLGLGAQPPTPEWGTMLNDGRAFFQPAPQLMIYPGLAITLAVIGSNLVGDGLRDVLDPRLKR